MLENYLNENTIRVKVSVDDWKQAIRAAGKLLEEEGVINSTYTEAMIENGEVNGAYFVLTPGVAVPHAKSESGVNRVGMSLITLDRPVDFLTSPNNPVRLVICLAATDNSTHIDALRVLADFLGDEESVSRVMEASGREEARDIIKNY